MLVNIKKTKYEGTDDCGSTAVTDDLFMHSSLPPAIKKHSSYQVKLQKEVKSTQNSQTIKK